jgi:hypothetical protein
VNVDVTRSRDKGSRALPSDADLRLLFHRLNNQLGIILAHAELLEARAVDEPSRARASQVVATVLETMKTARAMHRRIETGHVGA